MFCYQRNFAVPTENVGQQLLRSLMRGKDVAEKVGLVREIKTSGFDLKWLETEGYKEWYLWLKPEKRQAVDKLSDQKKVEAYCDGLKRGLPLVIFIANYEVMPNKKEVLGRWRQKAGVCLNGLCVMDLDHVVKTHDGVAAKAFWQQIMAHLDLKEIGILMVFVSPSGDGLKIVFKARMEWGNLIDNQKEMARFLGVSDYIDEKCKDGSRGHFLTTEDDLIYLDEEIFEYENRKFGEKYNGEYRSGRTQPTVCSAGHSLAGRRDSVHGIHNADKNASGKEGTNTNLTDNTNTLMYHGVAITAIIEKLLGGTVPGQGDRHDKMRDLAHLLRYVCDNSPKKVLEALKTQEWVNDLIGEGDPVEATVEGACKLKYGRQKPEELQKALQELEGKETTADTAGDPRNADLPLEEWGKEIEKLFDIYPCLKEICSGLHREAYPAAMFTGAAFLGTLMTRTWYYFYHRPEEERRLNYCVYVIGDPASGKSFATRLYKLLLSPIIAADKVGNDAINKYKKELKERGTSSKEQKKEALKHPDVII
ncbi:MAG: hypothetical protein II385_04995, partial [Bacteroidaceae bacterium]|nr:hypothetical protein [Bacteroidaceae bacterium]